MTNTGLQLRSLIRKNGELELSLARIDIPEPGPDQVVVRVEATPINPSDLGLLVGPADMSAAQPTSASVTSSPGNSIVGDYKVDFDAMDTNHDGSISRGEAKGNATLMQEFRGVDMNHNGKLSKDELKGWM